MGLCIYNFEGSGVCIHVDIHAFMCKAYVTCTVYIVHCTVDRAIWGHTETKNAVNPEKPIVKVESPVCECVCVSGR